MLTADQIQEKIQAGESSGVEFKQVEFRGDKLVTRQRDDLSDTIAAFANSHGGVILFGVDDDKRIVGVKRPDDLMDFLTEIIRDSVKPPIDDSYMECVPMLVHEGVKKPVVYMEIRKSLWVHQSAGGHFLRQGKSKRSMSTEQFFRLCQNRSSTSYIPFCERPVPRTGIETLDPALRRKFIGLQAVRYDAAPTESELVKLRKRKLLVKDEDGQDKASVAAVLMCCPKPDEHLTNAYIQAVCYRGRMRDANYQVDAKDFEGPLDEQILDAFAFVDKHNQISARKNIGREDRPQFSMKAVFEAIANAVVHRDYFIRGSKIRLFVFSDRLEIYSPGGLLNTLTVDVLEYHEVTRNGLLARLLSECALHDDRVQAITGREHFLERRGEGVPIILNESESLSGKKPQYQLHGEQLQLIIFAAPSLQDNGGSAGQ